MDIHIPAGAGTYRYWTRHLIEKGHLVGAEVRRAKWADLGAQIDAKNAGSSIPGEVMGQYPTTLAAQQAIESFAAADRA